MNLVISTLLFLGIYVHDIQVAYFKIHKEDNSLVIEFVFEKNDLTSALNELNFDLSDKNLQSYIKSNFSLSSNKEKQNLTFGKMRLKDKHIYVEGRTTVKKSHIENLEIENKCLTNIKGHSNIVEVVLHEKQRDFLMNDERTSIQINY